MCVQTKFVELQKFVENCAIDKTKNTIEKMQEIAKEHEGKCLSRNYINDKTKLEWECEKGHTWHAIPNNIKQGSWCPVCRLKKKV